MNPNAPISRQDLEAIVEYASLSPSSHNTQPWTLHIDKNRLTFGYDTHRQLTVGDPDSRELLISVGCFIQTLMIAAEAKGYQAQYRFIGNDQEKLAEVRLSPSSNVDRDTKWLSLIKTRHSDRRLYENQPIPETSLNQLNQLRVGKASIFITTEQIDFLAKMTYEATLAIMLTQEFRDELSKWVRHNWTRQPDGMPGYTQGMPGPISLVAKVVIRKSKKVAADQAKKDAKRVSRSGAVALICIQEDTASARLDAGRLYQTLCLQALEADIKTSAVSAALIEPSTAEAIVRRFKLKDRPVALVRLGYRAGSVRATPRLPLESFTTF